MRLRDGGFGILSLKDRVPVAVVSTAIKIKNDAEKDDQKSKRALTAIQSSSTLRKTVQHRTQKVYSRQGKQNSIENLNKMSIAEMMQPVSIPMEHSYMKIPKMDLSRTYCIL